MSEAGQAHEGVFDVEPESWQRAIGQSAGPKVAASDRVIEKAKLLAWSVKHEGGEIYSCPGSSGELHAIATHGQPRRAWGAWTCDCQFAQHGGMGCSHVRALLIRLNVVDGEPWYAYMADPFNPNPDESKSTEADEPKE